MLSLLDLMLHFFLFVCSLCEELGVSLRQQPNYQIVIQFSFPSFLHTYSIAQGLIHLFIFVLLKLPMCPVFPLMFCT